MRKVEFLDTSLRDGEQTPGLAAGKPASIAEMPHFSNCLAMAIFSLIEKLTPGVCSPSRRLVSKNSEYCRKFLTWILPYAKILNKTLNKGESQT